MNELLSQLWTPELQAAFTVVLVLLVILYVLSIVWVGGSKVRHQFRNI